MLSALLLTLFAAYILRRYTRSTQDVDRLPGPSSAIASWIWGHELLSFQHEATQMYSTWARTSGPLFRIKAALFHPDIIVAADHAAVQHIFADTATYVKSPAFRPPIANLIGKGLVWAEGDDHLRMRKLLAPAFSQESIKSMASDIFECAEKLESRLTNLVLSNNDGLTINIVEYISTCTLDIIGRVAFGHDFKASTPTPSLPPPPPIPHTRPSAQPTPPQTDAALIRTSWAHHVNTGLTPTAFIAPIVVRAFPPITQAPLPLMKAQGVVKTVVRRLAGRLVERERAEYESGGGKEDKGKGKDILSVLMRARREGEEGEGLSDEQILDNISTFTMVGHETTAGTLNFTLLELAQHPHIQARLRDEILAHGRDLAYDDIQKLEYLDAVVKEGLRLHPASPQTERVALKDDVIPLSTPVRANDGQMITSLAVREGQVFHIPFTTMHTNAAVWGPDAALFNPARWLTPGALPPPAALPHGWGGLVTFCDGPRNCIGWRLAVFEMKVILATLIRTLEFGDTPAVVQQKISPTLQPVVDGKGGVLPLYVSLA